MEVAVWYVKSRDGAVYGPATPASLLEWAKDGRVDPSGYVSNDREKWVPPQTVAFLEMKWLIESDVGVFGPFHRDVVKRMLSDGTVPADSRIYCRWDKPLEQEEPPAAAASAVVADVVVEPVEDKPARSSFGGIFKDADPEQLASLEAAARKELFAAKKFGLGGIFGRKK